MDKKNKILKVHIEADESRETNLWVMADSEELMDEYRDELIEAFLAANDWIPGSGAKMAIVTDIVSPNLFRNVSLINPLLLDKADMRKIPPIFCVNDQVFELCNVQPVLPAVRILKSLSDVSFLKESARAANFHLVGFSPNL